MGKDQWPWLGLSRQRVMTRRADLAAGERGGSWSDRVVARLGVGPEVAVTHDVIAYAGKQRVTDSRRARRGVTLGTAYPRCALKAPDTCGAHREDEQHCLPRHPGIGEAGSCRGSVGTPPVTCGATSQPPSCHRVTTAILTAACT